jgi:hypothetical protein
MESILMAFSRHGWSPPPLLGLRWLWYTAGCERKEVGDPFDSEIPLRKCDSPINPEHVGVPNDGKLRDKGFS